MTYQPQQLIPEAIARRPVLNEISIVIPTLGRAILEESLYWIAQGSAWPGEIIVVDQGDDTGVDGWLATLDSLGMGTRYIQAPRRGRAAGINRGLEQVTTPFVAITDDDCFVDAQWLQTMVEHLSRTPESVVTGRVDPAGDDVIVVVTAAEPAIYRRPRLTFDVMSGGNMGTSQAVLSQVGLFDEDACLRTSEDGEWSYRVLRSGIPIYYEPTMIVRHFGWRDEQSRTVQYRDYARSHGGFYGKYLRQGDWFIAARAIVHHLRASRRWLRGALTGDQEAARYGRAYVTGLLPGILAGLRSGPTS